jgi:nucleoside-diphosphate-sugar epimerase
MDVDRMKALGFHPSIRLERGIGQMIELYRNQKKAGIL